MPRLEAVGSGKLDFLCDWFGVRLVLCVIGLELEVGVEDVSFCSASWISARISTLTSGRLASSAGYC